MENNLVLIEDSNLSVAWAKVFLKITELGHAVHPLVVIISNLDGSMPKEDGRIRGELDQALETLGEAMCSTVANTIFPWSLWNPKADRATLYNRFLTILPKLRRHPRNRNGTYFARLTSFGNSKRNQLEHIITTYQQQNHRRTALQASIIDPELDHTHQKRRGFPCLQHVIFTPHGDHELEVTGIYANQYILNKAYGNYLGLARLGLFMARELNLRLTRMVCYSSFAVVGRKKSEIQGLREVMNLLISQENSTTENHLTEALPL